jgi:hypothetical protein
VNWETAFGIALATFAIAALRWAANRFPSEDEKRRRKREARLDELEDRKRIQELEKELRDLSGEDPEE